MAVNWIDAGNAVLNGVKVRFANADYAQQKTTLEEIVVLKPKRLFDDYARLIPYRHMRFNMGEQAIFEGGSDLILATTFPNVIIQAFDSRDPTPALLSHLDKMNLSERVELHY